MDRRVKNFIDFLEDQKVLAVRFNKSCCFCVMKKTTNSDKLNEILKASQFEALNGKSDDLTKKTVRC